VTKQGLSFFAAVTLLLGAWLAGCGSTESSPPGNIGDKGSGGDGGKVSPFGDSGTSEGDGGHIMVRTGDSGPFDGGTFTTLPAVPQVIFSQGSVLKDPSIVAIFFSNDDPTVAPQLQDFYTGIGNTQFWQATSEYGVGPATAKIVTLDAAAPAMIDDNTEINDAGDTALEVWLLGEITSGAIPANTPNTEYMINYPSGTTINAGGDSCTAYGGYHTDMLDNDNNNLSYGVIPRCSAEGTGQTTLQVVTTTASHELVEAATDPYPDYAPGYSQCDTPHIFWDEANSGSEVADMCQNDPEAYYQFSDFGYLVQRFWSNASASAGHDPCVPELPNTPFFIAMPELNDTGVFIYDGVTGEPQNYTVSSVNIPVGGTATVWVDVHSDGTLPDWDITAYDYNYFWTGDTSQELLDVSMPVTTGNNGDRLPVIITVKTAGNENTNMEVNNSELFVIQAAQGTSMTAPQHYWYGVVINN
jgi:hypothetical protein